jgi:tyrosine-protein kinase Etk/Wzc
MNNDKIPDGIEEQEINLLDLIAVIVKRKNLILTITGGALIISLIFTLLKPTLYTATARVIPPEKKNSVLISVLSTVMDKSEIPTALLGENLSENVQICAGILKSRAVADAVIRRLDLIKSFGTKSLEGAQTALRSIVNVEVGKDNIISITAQDKDPKRAKAIVNAFVEELGPKCVQLNLIQVSAESIVLAKMLNEIRRDLQESEESLKSFHDGNGTFKIKPQTLAALGAVGRINAAILDKHISSDRTKGYSYDEDAQMKLAQDEVAKLQGQLVIYERQSLNGRELADSASGVPYIIFNTLKTKADLFELLARQYRKARLSEAEAPTSIRVLDDTITAKKIKPKRSLVVILCTVTAFFIGIFMAFVREYAEKMPEDDRARWQEIKNLARIRRR